MFCKYCGTKLIDEAAFCHECGKATYEQPVYTPPAPPAQPAPPVQPVYVAPVQPAPAPPQYTYTVPANPVQPAPQPAATTPDLAELEKQILSCGIWGLCLSMLGVPGIILSTIANKKANAYKNLTGNLSDKARAGYRLGKAGKAVSIVMTVIWVIVISALENWIHYNFTNPFEYYDF